MRVKKPRPVCPCCGRPLRKYRAKSRNRDINLPEIARRLGYEIGGVDDGLDKTHIDQGYFK